MARTAWTILVCLPAALAAQEPPEADGEGEPVYIQQAEGAADADASPVYWPERITRDRVDAARAAQAPQVTGGTPSGPVAQLTGEEGVRAPVQLSAGDGTDPLAQLTEDERGVLLEAIEGTDICARQLQVPAIRQLCAQRLETRSADFRPRAVNILSPEERLLGEGLSGDRVATLERAIERLGRNAVSAQDFENQAIASVALAPADTPDPAANPGEGDAGNLSAETRALIEAIVNQVPGAGGPP